MLCKSCGYPINICNCLAKSFWPLLRGRRSKVCLLLVTYVLNSNGENLIFQFLVQLNSDIIFGKTISHFAKNLHLGSYHVVVSVLREVASFINYSSICQSKVRMFTFSVVSCFPVNVYRLFHIFFFLNDWSCYIS